MPNLPPTASQCLSTIHWMIDETHPNIDGNHRWFAMNRIDTIDENLRNIHEQQQKVKASSLQTKFKTINPPNDKISKTLRAVKMGQPQLLHDLTAISAGFSSDPSGKERSKKKLLRAWEWIFPWDIWWGIFNGIY